MVKYHRWIIIDHNTLPSNIIPICCLGCGKVFCNNSTFRRLTLSKSSIMAPVICLFTIVYCIIVTSSTSILCSDNYCADSVITCTPNEICNIECINNGCYNSTIHCPINNECMVICNGRNSCSFSTIHAEESSAFKLNLLANNPNTEPYHPQITKLTIYLSSAPHTNGNIITANGNPILYHPTFYSTAYKFENIHVYNVSITNGVMYYSSNFSNKCLFNIDHESHPQCIDDDAIMTTTITLNNAMQKLSLCYIL